MNDEIPEESNSKDFNFDSGILPKENSFYERVLIACKNDKISLILFLLIYVFLVFFMIAVNTAQDEDLTSYLVVHKFTFYLCAFMCIWCQIKCCLTNPGKLVHELNPHFVEFYIQIREEGIFRAMSFQEKVGRQFFSSIKDENFESDDFTDEDTIEYQAKTSIQPDAMEKVRTSHDVKLKRCTRCYVVRVPGVGHCAKCQGCILKMDHHCPWVINCIGQFNQKFFIQFILYTFFGILEGLSIISYYIWYKDKNLYTFHLDFSKIGTIQFFIAWL